MERISYTVFDLDGTLLNTKEGILAAVVQTMRDYDREVPSQELLNSFIGPPPQRTFQKLYNFSDVEAMEMANHFRSIYMKDDYLFNANPYKDIYSLMSLLVSNGIKVGVATYKREDLARKLLIGKGFEKYTQFIFGSDSAGNLKKDDIIRICLNEMGCKDYSKAVYIGDSPSDCHAATSVGIKFIAVTYGFGYRLKSDIQEDSCVCICNAVSEIMRFFSIW